MWILAGGDQARKERMRTQRCCDAMQMLCGLIACMSITPLPANERI